MPRVWIDTDIGTNSDDAFCLALAARDPRVELVGVSTVYGDVALRARIAEKILELAGAPDVPVGVGFGRPLTASIEPVMYGHEGRGLLDDETIERLESAAPTAPGFDAQADLLSLINEIARDTWIISIGPPTNLGWMQRGHPFERSMAMMGGSTNPEIVEFNWGRDPAAAQIVLDTDRELRIYPYEITRRVVLSDSDLDELRSGNELARVLADQTRRWLEVRPSTGRPPPHLPYLHDPVVLVGLLEPGLIDYEVVRLELDADSHPQIVDGEPNCALAGDIDEAGVKEVILSGILD